MNISKYERRILKLLYHSKNGLLLFTVYKRIDVTPSILFSFIQKYEKEGIVIYENEKLELTQKGEKLIIEQKVGKDIPKDKYSSIPSLFLAPRLKINEFYVPKLSETSSIFKIIKRGSEPN